MRTALSTACELRRALRLVPACCSEEGVVPVIKSLSVCLAPKTRSGLWSEMKRNMTPSKAQFKFKFTAKPPEVTQSNGSHIPSGRLPKRDPHVTENASREVNSGGSRPGGRRRPEVLSNGT